MKLCQSLFEYLGNPLYTVKVIMASKPVFGGYIGNQCSFLNVLKGILERALFPHNARYICTVEFKGYS